MFEGKPEATDSRPDGDDCGAPNNFAERNSPDHARPREGGAGLTEKRESIMQSLVNVHARLNQTGVTPTGCPSGQSRRPAVRPMRIFHAPTINNQ
ncbi:hypothetical protein IscW_ISCW022279 [Ixodes scapularis]|uniref:Uncharacterized protein n=1 Tax=Ixodes scapularis TaxID=6945 RepID=B7QEG0_IXOSC|nr:hypothetical protein IscW_ISCW022279 [Ixodes scapularis]|eukprot:XP_002413934.1 hypothetical protein IscW_ISCW022279 [Ixodes scapularis]